MRSHLIYIIISYHHFLISDQNLLRTYLDFEFAPGGGRVMKDEKR